MPSPETISLTLEELGALMTVEVAVELEPGTGLYAAADWWSANLPALGLSHTGMGIGEAIVGLAAQVREQLAFTPRGQEPPGCGPLFLKLRVAEREGRLEELLDGSAVLRNPRLERLAAAERLPDLAA